METDANNEREGYNTDKIVVEAVDVHKWLADLHVLLGVSLTMHEREVVIIIGPSGSGKSTFFGCLNHLEKIEKWETKIGGHYVGYKENDKEEAQAEAIRLMELVQLPEKLYEYPGKLSGGQQQRVAIAHAMAMHPKVK